MRICIRNRNRNLNRRQVIYQIDDVREFTYEGECGAGGQCSVLVVLPFNTNTNTNPPRGGEGLRYDWLS